MDQGRRDFLKLAAASAAFGIVGLQRKSALARLPVDPVSVLVLDFTGGWNVHASFAARTSPSVNPHGLYRGKDTGVIRPSNVLFKDRDRILSLDSKSWGMRIPGFEDVAPEYSVIGAMRHSLSYTLDDHPPSARFMGTGYMDRADTPGLGTVIGRYAPQGTKAPPAMIIDAGLASAEMGRAPGAWQPYAPLSMLHTALPVSGSDTLTWTGTESASDEVSRTLRRGLAANKIDLLRRYKEAFRTYRQFFLDDAIAVADPTKENARYVSGILGAGSPTNRQLLDAFGGAGYTDEGALALAFRCLEGGSRFVAVGCGTSHQPYGYDMHNDEESDYDLYVRGAQLLAGVSFLLTRCGLEKKVMVVALSEMARSYTSTMYNAAHGTDHGHMGLRSPKGLPGSTRQSVLLAHGPIAPQREAYAADPEYGDPVEASCVTAELLAMLAECAGVERAGHPWKDSPDGAALDADALARALIK
jgi:hypothetical protein